MSIEQALAENTSAIRELIAAISKGIPATGAQVAAVVAQAPKVEKAQAAAKAEPKAEPVTATEAPAVVDFEMVKKPFLQLVNTKGRDAGVAILTEFGVKQGGKLGEMAPENFAAALAAIQKALV